jgi:hypothetical protein
MHVGLDVIATFSCGMRGKVRDSQDTDPSRQKIALTNELVNPENWGRNQSYHASCDIGKQLYFDRTALLCTLAHLPSAVPDMRERILPL